jgi:hypothetical protein
MTMEQIVTISEKFVDVELSVDRTRPVKAAETVVDSTTSIVVGGSYAAAFCGCACFQFQGRSSSTRLAG